MPNCGNTGLQDGGVINNATITGSSIQGSVINGSHIEASAIHNLTEIDEASAKVIADAISKLSTEELRALAKAVSDAMPAISSASGPEVSKEESLPTSIAGSRQYMLGAPNGWLEMQGVVVPAYKKQV